MPEQNQPISGSFGDIYSAALPETQQATQQQAQLQLYQNRMAQQQRMREDALFDRMQNQEIAKVRSADAPDIANAFSQWRNADIQSETYKGNDPKQYNGLSMAANQAYATVAKKIAQSSELKNQALQMQQEYKVHPERFADNFADLQHTMLDTPYEQLKNVKVGNNTYDLSNKQTYMYPGMPGYGKLVTASYGKPQKITLDEGPIDANGIQNRQSTYSYGNSPAQVKSTISSNLATDPRGQRNAAYILSTQYPADVINNINNSYHNLPQDYWQKSGINQPQNVEPTDPNNSVDLLSSLEAKKYAINNQPRLEASKNVTNLNNENLQKEGLQEQMEKVRQNGRIDLAYIHGAISRNNNLADKVQGAQLNDAILDGHVQAFQQAAMKNKPIPSTDPATGQPTVEYPVTMDQNIKKLFPLQGQGGPADKTSVQEIRVNPNGDLIGYYPGAQGSTQRPYVIIPREQFKFDLGNEAKSYKGSVPAGMGTKIPASANKIDVNKIAQQYGF